MLKNSITLVLLLLCISTSAQSPGDTITIQTFDYSSTTRDTMINFPNNSMTYEKIIMSYNMRCKDDVVNTPTVSMSGATLAQASAGTLKYVSGVPYYTNNATLTLDGVTVYDWIGQCYAQTSSPFAVARGTNQESTTGSTISTQYSTYAQIDGTTTFLDSGIPKANTGANSGAAYSLGDVTVKK